MSERITGEDVRVMHFKGGPWYETGRFVDRLGAQLDADARRLADLEAENGRLKYALAEARKPKAEVWRMRSPGGCVSQTAGTSADDIRFTLGSWEDGTPVREVKNAAGDILLLAEGRPIPEGWA